MKNNLSWVILHTALMITVVINLLSGLRIATLNRPELLWLNAILPQGYVHGLHLVGAIAFVTLAAVYIVYRLFLMERKSSARGYHRLVIWLGWGCLSALLISGLNAYFGGLDSGRLHWWAAVLLMGYLVLHAVVYFIQHGIAVFKYISIPSLNRWQAHMVLMACGGVIAIAVFLIMTRTHQPLPVTTIDLEQFIHIDGKADEPHWQNARQIEVPSFGGANFVDGKTNIQVRALENGVEAFFHISWDDPDRSLRHLPLVKTAQGWQVQQQGFERFDETAHYEDKFAVILSDSCRFGAAATAHLGPKPLKDKPGNFSGKGYHYSRDGAVVDLWHWKAVRTNAMYIADDNFIGQPDAHRPASRRYTAGYMPDGKDSGAYVMNWKWFKKDIIVPKRLPKSADLLQPYQSEQSAETDWVIPWFSYEPYSVQKDTYPVGTVMPSVMYRSNRFEGDRADVRAFAQWENGRWSMELSRRLDTGSENDVALNDGVCLWMAAFDKAQIAHTRHNRAIELQMRNVL